MSSLKISCVGLWKDFIIKKKKFIITIENCPGLRFGNYGKINYRYKNYTI